MIRVVIKSLILLVIAFALSFIAFLNVTPGYFQVKSGLCTCNGVEYIKDSENPIKNIDPSKPKVLCIAACNNPTWIESFLLLSSNIDFSR